MELYILRHGIAADSPPSGMSDSERTLTPEGILKMEAEARGMYRLGIELDILLSSPLVRARQTAEIAGRVLGLEVQLTDTLAPGGNLHNLLRLLNEHRHTNRMMIVGHEPDLSRVIAGLTGGSRVLMKKGGLGRVDLEALREGAGTLVWLLPPRLLRELGS